VFNVPESLFTREKLQGTIDITLIADPKVKAKGTVREVSPSIDTATGTVRVKIGIDPTPPAMTLGASVIGTGRYRPRKLVQLPWGALSSRDGKPVVWVVDPRTKAVSARVVTIESYQTGEVVIASGLRAGELVVSAGAQLLWPNQVVALAAEAAR
jgi:multidrug efflux pump subunit AcrA (membrane-fusion protein)